VQSAGLCVGNVGGGAALEAKTAMKRIGLNIESHKQTPISDINLNEFEFVIALTKRVRQDLLERYGVDESKILSVYVDDPFGSDIEQYVKCANVIAKKLGKIEFPKN
jgi:protein-tyrosine-phosphatase